MKNLSCPKLMVCHQMFWSSWSSKKHWPVFWRLESMNKKWGHSLGINLHNINYKDPIQRAYRKNGTWDPRPQLGHKTHEEGPKTQIPTIPSATQDPGPQNIQVKPRTRDPLVSFNRKISNFSATPTSLY